jgi:Uma2 family endonuclease
LVLLRGWAARQPKPIPLRHEGPINRVPELCSEIVSPSKPTYDRFSKRLIYAEAGVQELWTIEPGYYVERSRGGNLREVEKLESTVESPLLPGLKIDLGELFAE